jgi:hypothetical protein
MTPPNLSSLLEAAVLAISTCFPQAPTSACASASAPTAVATTATPSPMSALTQGFVISDRTLILLKEHLHFLREVSRGDAPLVSKRVASLAAIAWFECSEATGYALPIPAACTGPDGQMFYSWDRGEHHFELEIASDGEGTFFYRNRESGDLWVEDYRPDEGIAADAVQRLKLFI